MTQEELAEHIKRIRNDYCKGTMRDTLNRFVPRPVGPRTAIIRVPEPLAMHEFRGSVEEALVLTRQRMQDALDRINEGLRAGGRLRTYPNSVLRQLNQAARRAAPIGRPACIAAPHRLYARSFHTRTLVSDREKSGRRPPVAFKA